MRAARLNKKGKLQIKSETQNEFGERINSWYHVVDVRFGLEPLSGKQLLAAQQFKSEITHRVVMRYRDNISNKNRILFKNRILDIHHVINVDEKNRELQLGVSEGLTNG